MHVVLTLVGIVATVIVVAGLCSKLDLPSPLVLIVVGVVGSYLPFVPDVALEPEVVLFGLLPPLLYAAALQTSLVDFNAHRRAILLLSVGLVAFTTVGVALIVHALLPDLGWWPAFAIGAVVAPPDAVAATAIGRRIGLPRRIVTILEGESLLNDATALVALNTAIGAAGAAVAWKAVGLDFVIAAGGGVLVGLVFFIGIGFIRKHVTDPVLDTGLSFLTPFAAYIAAEEIHASGVISVVVAGLLLGHKSPMLQTAQARIAERLTWRSVAFLLESSVFLLIGLQARSIIGDAFGGEVTTGTIFAVCSATLVGVIVLRLVWVFFSRYFLVRPRADGGVGRPPWTYTFLVGWAGMRGVVTLAAAFVIPRDTEHRDVLLLIAFTVAAGTLFIQGLSLPWLARRLKVPSPDPAADALARANLLHQAGQAGLAVLDKLEEDDPHSVSDQIRDRVLRRDNAAWERFGGSDGDTERHLRAAAQADDRRRARPGAGGPLDGHGRPRGRRRGALHARHRGVDARLLGRGARTGPGRRHCHGPRGRLRAPAEGASARRRGHPRRVRRLPGHRHHLGAPAHVRHLRPHRLLRLLTRAPRERPPRLLGPRGDALGRGRRGLALVLRGPDDGVSVAPGIG